MGPPVFVSWTVHVSLQPHQPHLGTAVRQRHWSARESLIQTRRPITAHTVPSTDRAGSGANRLACARPRTAGHAAWQGWHLSKRAVKVTVASVCSAKLSRCVCIWMVVVLETLPFANGDPGPDVSVMRGVGAARRFFSGEKDSRGSRARGWPLGQTTADAFSGVLNFSCVRCVVLLTYCQLVDPITC